MTKHIDMSKHCVEDRLDRLTYIATKVGFGNILFEKASNGRRECITDTGIILVKALKKEFLITAYIPSLKKVIALYRSTFGAKKRMPQALYNKIQKNQKYAKNQNNEQE